MKRAFMRLLGLSLLTSTALVPAALAQETGSQAQQERGCDDLQSLIQSNTAQLNPDWVNQANTAIEQNRTANCVTLFEQANAELGLDQQPGGTGQQDTETAGMSGPTVTVEQQPAQVAVTQPQPQVSVDQGQPQIEVLQGSPTVHVQMANPVITIEQPPPEIIITMPDPQVAVSSAEPQVEVRQAEPRVSVTQAEPEVQLTQPQQEAEVAVNRAQPQVTFRAAEPTVDFQLTGEPEVRISQGGEPKITFRRAGEAETAEAGQELPDEQEQQTAQTDQQLPDEQEQQTAQTDQQLPDEQEQQTAQTDQQLPDEQEQQTAQADQQLPDEQEQQTAQADQPQEMQQVDETTTGSIGQQVDIAALLTAGAGQDMAIGEPREVSPQDLIGKTLVNADGVDLGTVESLVEAQGRQYVVLAADSVLGDGQAGVVLPIESIVMEEDRLVLRGLSEPEMAQLAAYDATQAQPIAEGTQLQVSSR